MAFAAILVQFAIAIAPLQDESRDSSIEVTTVDADGAPVGDVPVEWLSSEYHQRHVTSRTSGATSFNDLMFEWFDARERDADQLAELMEWCAKSNPRARTGVPCGINAATSFLFGSERRIRLVVEPIRFVECAVTDARGQSVVNEYDVALQFTDGTVSASMTVDQFACRKGRIRVPIPIARFATMRMRAMRESRWSAWIDIAASADAAEPLLLQLASEALMTGRLLTPAGEPLRDEVVVAVACDRQPMNTCIEARGDQSFNDDIERATPFDSEQDGDLDDGAFRGAHRVTIRTGDDGSFRVQIPFDTFDLKAPRTFRLDVHRPHGRCWFADVPFDASMEAGTRDVGVIQLIADPRMVCGRIVDDRGIPVRGVDLRSRFARQYGGPEVRSVAVTDKHGRFRFAPEEPIAIVASKVNFLSAPALTVDPGADDVEIRLIRCATLNVTCKASTTLIPERFELRWHTADTVGSTMLHSWSSVIDALPAGALTVDVVLHDDGATPIVTQTITIDPGAVADFACDLSNCGLVTLRLRTDDGADVGGARASIAGTQRVVGPAAMSTLRVPIASATVALTISASGCAPVTGVYGHGEHDVILTRAH